MAAHLLGAYLRGVKLTQVDWRGAKHLSTVKSTFQWPSVDWIWGNSFDPDLGGVSTFDKSGFD